ncbi:MAG: acyl CoA:acetate/3-ketoacid CoA transferase, partial [Oscillospiraceae bacterium]|nr:acyl CoA:acetate/3-ketoacid CoA transferase [Oscillospiraceae bacterium]
MCAKIATAKEVADIIESGKVYCTEGFVGAGQADEVLKAIEDRFLETGKPNNMTLIYSAGQGIKQADGSYNKGTNRLGHEGMTTKIIAGHYNHAPQLQELAMENKAKAYNLPQGVLSQMYRDMAAKRPTISRVGLKTFVDPRLDGGRINDITTEDIVHLIEIGGEEYLHYEYPETIDYAILRGTYADEKGNVVLDHEGCILGVLPIAQATKCSGGKVIVQVERVVKNGSLDPKDVRIPGIYVDYIVPVQDMQYHKQTVNVDFDASLCGEIVAPSGSSAVKPLDVRKVIGRRCAMELPANSIVNLGIGMPEEVASVAAEEGCADTMTLTVESGPIGGVPLSGFDFGVAISLDAIIDSAAQFDFYDGGGLDLAILGLAECGKHGDINVSKFGPRLAGAGGFINITQNAKRVIFCGTFTAKGLKLEIGGGQLKILQEGSKKKFVDTVEHVTFSSEYALSTGQPVLYVTE